MMVSTAEVMIIVMGLTGAGKSSFLKLLTRNEEIPISHSECCKLAILIFLLQFLPIKIHNGFPQMVIDH